MKQEQSDAIVCYILSKRQGVEMIAKMLGKPEPDVRKLIAEGKRILRDRDERRQSS